MSRNFPRRRSLLAVLLLASGWIFLPAQVVGATEADPQYCVYLYPQPNLGFTICTPE